MINYIFEKKQYIKKNKKTDWYPPKCALKLFFLSGVDWAYFCPEPNISFLRKEVIDSGHISYMLPDEKQFSKHFRRKNDFVIFKLFFEYVFHFYVQWITLAFKYISVYSLVVVNRIWATAYTCVPILLNHRSTYKICILPRWPTRPASDQVLSERSWFNNGRRRLETLGFRSEQNRPKNQYNEVILEPNGIASINN